MLVWKTNSMMVIVNGSSPTSQGQQRRKKNIFMKHNNRLSTIFHEDIHLISNLDHKLDIMKMLRLFSGLPNTGSQIFTLHCIFSHFIFFSNKKVAASRSTYKERLCSEQKQPLCSQLTKHHLISISPV